MTSFRMEDRFQNASPLGDYVDGFEEFSVSNNFISKVLNNQSDVEKIDGYKGHPVTGLGDVPTPAPIVQFILDSVGYTSDNPIEKQRIIDLSCGTGSFIKEIVNRLQQRFESTGIDINSPEGARQIISTVRNNVVAVDINRLAVWGTAQLVVNELRDEIENNNEQNPVGYLKIYNSNTLDPSLLETLGSFDYVVTNPPYIRNDEIDSEDDEYYRQQFKSAIGKYDMYTLFFEQGIRMLSAGGKLGIVCPNRFHETNYGRPLREFILSQALIEAIVDLAEDPFPVVNAYPTISILQKRSTQFPKYQYENRFHYCESDISNLDEVGEIIQGKRNCSNSTFCTEIEQNEMDDGAWRFLTPEIHDLKSKFEQEMPLFKETRAEIHTGIATGADKIFIVGEADQERIESDLLYPLVRGKDIGRGGIKNDLESLLNPYRDNGRTIDLSMYPEAEKYLEHFRSELEDRHCVTERNKGWYETHDTIHNVDELRRKIVTPDLASSARFAIVEDTITHNTAYTITYPGSLELLAGVMSSSVFEFILKASLPSMESGFWRQMKRDFNDLSIPNIEKIPRAEASEIEEAYLSENWEILDAILYQLLDISDEEQKAIESHINS